MNIEKLLEKRAKLLAEVDGADEKRFEEIKAETRQLDELIAEAKNEGQSLRTQVVNGYTTPDIVLSGIHKDERGNNFMTDKSEVRALQKFITTGVNGMTDTEQRALNVNGSSAVIPTSIHNTLISSEKYSDLIHRAQIFEQGGAGKIYIPVASNTSADWKIENSDKDLEANSYEKNPTLTKLELGGFELMRLMQLSAAASSLSAEGFENLMLELLAAEVIEALEKSFISGTGVGQPKGLDELTWTPKVNQILTATKTTPIEAKDIAEALSLLPQRYARGAIVLCNSDMMYQISQFTGTSELAYSMETGATKFLGKDIIVSEHVSNDLVYIVDPLQLYVRFAQPLMIEMDRSAGFTSASIYLRSLCVVDSCWNPTACVAVGLGTGA